MSIFGSLVVVLIDRKNLLNYIIMNSFGEIGLIYDILAKLSDFQTLLVIVKKLRVIPRVLTNLHRNEHPQFLSYIVHGFWDDYYVWPINLFIQNAAVNIDEKDCIRNVSILPNNIKRF